VNRGLCMYWGTSRWSPTEIVEGFNVAKTLACCPPIVELSEYHWFHREKVELYMAELYNKMGVGLMTWSPPGFGLCLGGTNEEVQNLLTKLCLKVP